MRSAHGGYDLRGCLLYTSSPQAALHGDRQIMPDMAADFFHSLLQLLGKRKVGHRLEHIIQRPYRIPLDGILRQDVYKRQPWSVQP